MKSKTLQAYTCPWAFDAGWKHGIKGLEWPPPGIASVYFRLAEKRDMRTGYLVGRAIYRRLNQ